MTTFSIKKSQQQPLLGVANSIWKNHGYDPIKTILFAQTHRFDLTQIYLSSQLINDAITCRKIAKTAAFHKIPLIFHAPDEAIINNHIQKQFSRCIRNFFTPNICMDGIPVIVWHILEKAGHASIMKFQHFLKKEGFLSAPENMTRIEKNETKTQAPKTLELLWNDTCNIPVLDLPRYFLTNGFEKSEKSACNAIEKINTVQKVIIHLIDTRTHAGNRNDWTEPGKGIIPWCHFFEKIQQKALIRAVILEYEDRILSLNAQQWLRMQFGIPG